MLREFYRQAIPSLPRSDALHNCPIWATLSARSPSCVKQSGQAEQICCGTNHQIFRELPRRSLNFATWPASSACWFPKHWGCFAFPMKRRGSLIVPEALAQADMVTLSLGFFIPLGSLSRAAAKVWEGRNLKQRPVSSELKIWSRVKSLQLKSLEWTLQLLSYLHWLSHPR